MSEAQTQKFLVSMKNTLEIEILVTLEEILTGVHFDYKIPRRIFDKEGRLSIMGRTFCG